MRYPTMGKNPRNAVSVPALSGGVNFADALNLVDDNQMTDCKNVWYKDGVLQTRPGLGVSSVITEDYVSNINNSFEKYSVELEQFVDGIKPHIFVIKETREDKSGIMRVQIFLNDYSREFQIKQEFEVMPQSELFYAGKETFENGKGIYMLASEEGGTNALYEIIEEGTKTSLKKLGPDDLYAPCVYINGKGNTYEDLVVGLETKYAPASFFEGYSAISDAWANFCYTTDGASNQFPVPHKLDDCYLCVEYSYTHRGGSKPTPVFKIEKGKELDYVDTKWGDKVYITTNVILGYIQFWKKNPDWNQGDENQSQWLPYTFASALGVKTNNLKIKIRPITPAKTNLIGMKKSTWFGGAANGINSGTRLFVSGSAEKPNLIMWSDLNNPIYFPENNYAYVGEETQSITALKKQSDMLVIFKENELFYTTYVEGETYTAEDVVDGKVVDVTTASAKFPMIQIHGFIGCDLPVSIQLCGDRLVWATTDRKVYLLKSANQYSNANVSPLHALIEKPLNAITEEELQKVKSCIYDGRYLLSFGNKTFVLDYDYYYFNALPSYSDSKKSQKKMVWHVWEFASKNNDYETYVSNGDRCAVLGISVGNMQGEKYLVEIIKNEFNSSENDYGFKVIESVIQTKMFDFNAMDRFKSIEQMYVGFGEVEGETSVQYLTDRGTLDKGVVEISSNGDMQSPQFIKTKRFLPGIKRALRFGVRFTAKGRVAISGVLIKYKYMGVTR